MQTRKLYYEDCHLSRFTGRVTGCEKKEKGYEITLDATAFYPEGGGQACDLGTLGNVRVLDTRERGEEILHLCDGPLTVGKTVEGVIDYERRFRLMQQHTGEHIVSGIVHRHFGWHNVGFHMGSELVTIDFDGPIPAEALAEIEREANRAVWQNLAVKCWYPSPEELPDVGYRSKKALPWPVRVVEVPGFDKCACCGVHVAATGEIGLIKLFSCVKFHQGVRIEMACGSRALDILTRVYEQNRQVSQAFSARLLETGEAARRMNEALAAEKYRSAQLQRQIFRGIAKNYVSCENAVRFEPGLASGELRELADAIAGEVSGWAAVFSGSDEAGYGVCVISRSADVKALGTAMNRALSGRGGGKPGSFQGTVRATEAEIRAFFGES